MRIKYQCFAPWVLLIPILWIAFALRIHTIADQSLWGDEVYTWLVAPNWPDAHAVEARIFVYFGLVVPWRAIIPNEFGIRWPSVLAGVLAVAVIFQVGKQLHHWRSGLIAAALLTVSPIALYYSQEARSFSLVVLGTLWTLWMIPLMERGVRWARWSYRVAAVVITGLHLLAAVPWLLVQNGFLAFRKWRTGRGPEWWLLKYIILEIALTVLVILLLGLIGFYGFDQGLEWIPQTTALDALGQFGAAGSGLILLLEKPSILVAAFGIGLPIVLAIVAWRDSARPKLHSDGWDGTWTLLLLGALIILPPLGILIVSYAGKPLWVLRYLLPSLSAVALLLGMGFNSIRPRYVGWAAALILAAYSGTLAIKSFNDPLSSRGDWKGLFSYISQVIRADEAVVICPGRDVVTGYYSEYFYGGHLTNEIVPLEVGTEARSQQISAFLANHRRVFVVLTDQCELYSDDWSAIPISSEHRAEKTAFTRLMLYVYK